MTSFKTSSVLALSLLLVACGGGGGANPNSPTWVTSSVVGVDASETYVDATPTGSYIAELAKQAPSFSAVSGLNNYTLNDSSGGSNSSVVFNTTEATSDNIYEGSVNGTNTSFRLGGTTWSSARFGVLKNPLNNTATSPVRYTPFFVAVASASPATLTDATYQTNGLAVGVMIGEKGKYDLECSFSAAYTKTTQELALRFKDCLATKVGLTNSFITWAGTVTIGLNSDETTMHYSEFFDPDFPVPDPQPGQINIPIVPQSVDFKVQSSGYQFGGPTGEELVGAITFKSTNSNDPYLLTFAFGAKK
jgi:hypothetical protein